jgi:hypothetical protein
MGHCHAETRLVATQTLLNASRGILVVVTHGDILAVAINATQQNASVHADFWRMSDKAAPLRRACH